MIDRLTRLAERLIFPLAVIAGAIGLFYWYWTTTPSYALTCVKDSLSHHDGEMFEKYVDIDSITSHAFDDLLDGPARGELLGRMDNFIGVGFIRFFKREIVGVAHERVAEFVRDKNVELASLSDGNASTFGKYKIKPQIRQALVDYGLNRYGYKGIKYLNQNGPQALLGLEFYSPRMRNSYVVEFKMEDVGGFWRVTQVMNLNDLVDQYFRWRMKQTAYYPAAIGTGLAVL